MEDTENSRGTIYKHILEGLSSAVLLFDQDLRLDYINPTGEMLFEASANRLQNMALDELISSGDSKLRESIYHAFATSHPVTERETCINFPGNRTATVDCAITPLRDSHDRKSLLLELQQIDRTLRISREENQLSQNKSIRALLRGMAHEVKNPLGGIRGAAQLLERELPNDSLREYTSVIIEEADRLRNLVNRMLGPNAIPNRTMLNIHEIIHHVEQLVSIEQEKEINFNNDYDPSIPELYADRDQLIQALLNIVGNAAEHGQITVRTRAVRKFTIGHTIYKLVCQIDVIDNGPGIEKDMMEKIFFPMVTTRADGTGLGLPLAQSLIQQHDGIIQCHSEPGNTMFSILIPIKSEKEVSE